MSGILYILATNYDRKDLENSKIGLENSRIFFLPNEWEPCTSKMEGDTTKYGQLYTFSRLLLSYKLATKH